jgi:hypothetical protein
MILFSNRRNPAKKTWDTVQMEEARVRSSHRLAVHVVQRFVFLVRLEELGEGFQLCARVY